MTSTHRRQPAVEPAAARNRTATAFDTSRTTLYVIVADSPTTRKGNAKAGAGIRRRETEIGVQETRIAFSQTSLDVAGKRGRRVATVIRPGYNRDAFDDPQSPNSSGRNAA